METKTGTAAATPEVQDGKQTDGQPTGTAAQAAGQAKVYDQSYVDNLIAEQTKAQEAAVAEALKVAAMDADKKAQYEKEQAEKRQAQREADIARRELKADAREVLNEKGIPGEFLDMLLGKDMKETKANMDVFKTAFDAAVQKQVEIRLVGKTPQTGNAGAGATSEAESIAAEIAKYI